MPVAGYDGIDAASSPLKLRGCFRIDPAAVAAPTPAPQATPLVAPFWFRCFDAGRLTADLAAGAASAYDIAPDPPPGFDLMLAIYPDGRGYLWRQLNGRCTPTAAISSPTSWPSPAASSPTSSARRSTTGCRCSAASNPDPASAVLVR